MLEEKFEESEEEFFVIVETGTTVLVLGLFVRLRGVFETLFTPSW